MHVGILAIQGDFAAHYDKVLPLCRCVSLIRNVEQLEKIDRLIIPGGESTVFLKLLDNEFRLALKEKISRGMPTLATCAGSILLAKRVENPEQDSLQLLSCTAIRNSYGRQLDSFITPKLEISDEGRNNFSKLLPNQDTSEIEGIFIRAPKFKELDRNVSALLFHNNDPVLIKERNILAATFHPELSEKNSHIHELFLNI